MFIKQKIVSFLFIALLTMPILLCGYFLWQQHWVKEAMEEQLEKSQLTAISILKKDVQWVEYGKELIVNGEMFDVKSIEAIGETLHIKGLYDKAEKKIKQKIASLLHQKKTSDSPIQKLIAKFSVPIICNKNYNYQFSKAIITSTKKYTSLNKEDLHFFEIEPTTPPPNCI